VTRHVSWFVSDIAGHRNRLGHQGFYVLHCASASRGT